MYFFYFRSDSDPCFHETDPMIRIRIKNEMDPQHWCDNIHYNKTWFQTKVAELEEGMEANLGSQSAVLRTSMEQEFNEKMKVFFEYILSESDVSTHFLNCIS